jgi:hypothetical protein
MGFNVIRSKLFWINIKNKIKNALDYNRYNAKKL